MNLTNILPKQSCLLCGSLDKECICTECIAQFSNHTQRCKSCAIPLTSNLDFCGVCLKNAPIFDNTYTVYDYISPVSDLIKLLKYQQKLCIADYFSNCLMKKFNTIIASGNSYDVIIPMPLNSARLFERGYNQVIELLRKVQKNTTINIDTHSCKRTKTTRPLSSMKLPQRKKEILGAFKVVRKIPYKTALLVDDVMTTGSSLNELAKTIVNNSAIEKCDVLILARAELTNH